MKFTHILAILLVLSVCFARRVHRRSRHHSRRHHRIAPTTNPFYRFVTGFLKEVSGNPDLFDTCSAMVPGWQTANNQPEEAQIATGSSGMSSIISTIAGAIGSAIDLACKFKAKIISWLTGRYRRYIRLFLQGKTRKSFKRWSVWGSIKSAASSVGNAVSNAASAVGNAVVSGAKAVGNAVASGATAVWNGAKKLGSAVISGLEAVWDKVVSGFKPIWEKFLDIQASIIAFYKSDFVQKLIAFGQCLLSKGVIAAAKQVVAVFQALAALIPTLATPAGWVNLAANLICGWRNLVDGGKLFISGIQSTVAADKWGFWGQTLGKFMLTASGI